MAAIKSFTSLEQSKVLAKILPLESADMEYMFLKKDGSKVSEVPFVKDGFEEPECCYTFIPCWSLAALLNILPSYEINNFGYGIQLDVNREALATEGDETLLDLVVNMIIHLYKLKML